MNYDAKSDKAIIEFLSHLKDKTDTPIRILEIGCGSGVRSEYLTKILPHWEVIASDYGRSRPKDLSSTVPYIHQDVHEISFRDNYFDAVFSVAVSEHYSDTAKALYEQHRILKPGGLFYFVHTPFFSCSKGHHAHTSKEHCLIFPPYGHLYLKEQEFLGRTLDRVREFDLLDKISEVEIQRTVHRIYNRRDLSRLWFKDFLSIFNELPFDTAQWIEVDDLLFNKYEANLAIKFLPNSATVDDLKVEKLRCAAFKKNGA